MKKMFLLLTIMIGTLTIHAENYTYLTFETSDGAKVSVSAASLSITISEMTLTAGNLTFPLSNLSKMYFSNSDETSGIKTITAEELNETSEIYDLNGCKVSTEQLQTGVYVIKDKNETYKIVVK